MIDIWGKDIPGFNSEFGSEIPGIEPYLLNKSEQHSAFIICPGGGYEFKSPHEGEPAALWLNSIGISAFVLDYRVAPYKHPFPFYDAKRAVRYIRYHSGEWNINPDKIGILGFSAGGHLSATLGTHFDDGDEASADPVDRVSCKPDAMVLCYPVITFGDHRHQGSMENLLGGNPPADLQFSLSNENKVTEKTPPTFLWHTADDELVPVENSLLFAGELSKHKVNYELHIFSHGEHGLGMAESRPRLREWTELCAKWLKEIGF